MSLKLYSTCISVLQNFRFFFRPPPKLPKFAKFRHYLDGEENSDGRGTLSRAAFLRVLLAASSACDRRRWLPIPPRLTATWAQTPHLAPARAPSRTMIRSQGISTLLIMSLLKSRNQGPCRSVRGRHDRRRRKACAQPGGWPAATWRGAASGPPLCMSTKNVAVWLEACKFRSA